MPSDPDAPAVETLRHHVITHHPRALERLAHLVNHDTPSLDAAANDAAFRTLATWCEEHGASTERLSATAPHANHLAARWHARGEARVHILILTHVDTVWPIDETTRRPFAIENDHATGPGIFDMKAGIIQSLEAIDAFRSTRESDDADVTLLITSDEEVGSPTSRSHIEREARDASVVLVPEPSKEGALKTARKGVGMYRVQAMGRSAHAGLEPERGRSAILEMARHISTIDALNDPTCGTTVTVGMISGGSARNVVAERCHVDVDVRTKTIEESARVHDALMSLHAIDPDVTLSIEGGTNRPPMVRTASTSRLYERAAALARLLDEPVAETMVGGGSDGNFTAALDRPTLDGLGAVGAGAHAQHERIDVQRSLIVRTTLLAGLLADLTLNGTPEAQ